MSTLRIGEPGEKIRWGNVVFSGRLRRGGRVGLIIGWNGWHIVNRRNLSGTRQYVEGGQGGRRQKCRSSAKKIAWFQFSSPGKREVLVAVRQEKDCGVREANTREYIYQVVTSQSWGTSATNQRDGQGLRF